MNRIERIEGALTADAPHDVLLRAEDVRALLRLVKAVQTSSGEIHECLSDEEAAALAALEEPCE